MEAGSQYCYHQLLRSSDFRMLRRGLLDDHEGELFPQYIIQGLPLWKSANI